MEITFLLLVYKVTESHRSRYVPLDTGPVLVPIH